MCGVNVAPHDTFPIPSALCPISLLPYGFVCDGLLGRTSRTLRGSCGLFLVVIVWPLITKRTIGEGVVGRGG